MTQMMTQKQKVDTVRTMLDKLKPQIALALPRHMTADRMARVAMTCILRTPKLLNCDPTSLAGAIVTCSQLGLEPDPLLGHAHLVPFRNQTRGITEVVVIPGYKGLMKLARNSGEIATIDAHIVRQRDVFRYAYGLKPTLHHVPYQGPEDPGQGTHYYAVAIMKAGAGQFIVMTRAEIEAHRDRFVRHLADDSVWRTDFDAMAMKTSIRMLAKFLPASVELQRAAALDEQVEAGIPQDLGAVIIDASSIVVSDDTDAGMSGATRQETPDQPSTLDRLATQLKPHDEKPGASVAISPLGASTATLQTDSPPGRADLFDPRTDLRQAIGIARTALKKPLADDEFSSLMAHFGVQSLQAADVAALEEILHLLRSYAAREASAVKLVNSFRRST